MSAKTIELSLSAGYSGWIAGVVNSSLSQKAYIEVLDKEGNSLASTTFKGKGTRVNMKVVVNSRDHWSFGPFEDDATVRVTIKHSKDDGKSFSDSTMVGPLKVHKSPDIDYPFEFIASTIVSDDGHDQLDDSATVTILQYKQTSK